MLIDDYGCKVDTAAAEGKTPLHCAAQFGHQQCCELLLARGADPNARETRYGATPLALATFHGHAGCVAALLARDADPMLTNVHEQTSIELAVTAAPAVRAVYSAYGRQKAVVVGSPGKADDSALLSADFDRVLRDIDGVVDTIDAPPTATDDVMRDVNHAFGGLVHNLRALTERRASDAEFDQIAASLIKEEHDEREAKQQLLSIQQQQQQQQEDENQKKKNHHDHSDEDSDDHNDRPTFVEDPNSELEENNKQLQEELKLLNARRGKKNIHFK
jgi:hypothetical protein